MQFVYEAIEFEPWRCDLREEYLLAIEANFRIVDGDRLLFSEVRLPVAELAWALNLWLGKADRGDFRLDSMDSDVIGLVTIAREGDGWVVYSEWTPHLRSRQVPTDVMEACVRDFIRTLERDLVAHGLDADWILARDGGTREPSVRPEPVRFCPCGTGRVVVARRLAGQVIAMCAACAGIYADVDPNGRIGRHVLGTDDDPT